MLDQTPVSQNSPETYLGSSRMQYYFPGGRVGNGKKVFRLSENLSSNSFSLGGEWDIQDENSMTGKDAMLNYNFTADKVFLVLRPRKNSSATVRVLIDGKVVNSERAGADVTDGIVKVDTDRLYNLIDLKGNAGSHILKLEFLTPGIEAFAFTFG